MTDLLRPRGAPRRRVQVMGIVNATPDSFSDGGLRASARAAADHGLRLAAAGADMIDVGGESTRPGASPVPEAEELDRVVPIVERLAREAGVPVSVDTMKPAVARAAVAAGAAMWNDVSALRGSPESLRAAAELGCQVVLMHMQGDPRTMQAKPRYGDVAAEVAAFLARRAEAAMAAGIAREKIWLDPGVGFGKHVTEHNLPLLARLGEITALGFPVLLGVSRKSWIGRIDGGDPAPHERLGGSIAGALAGAAAGVACVRVHDVRETVQALRVWSAIDAAAPAR